MKPITTTLNAIRAHKPCVPGWEELLTYLGKTKADDEPLSFLTILESNGLDDTIWCMRTAPEHDSLWRHFAVDCAEQVQPLMTDKRSTDALRIARRFADGQATADELQAAREAAGAATRDTARDTAWDTAGDAAWDVAVQWQTDRLRELLTAGEWSPVGSVGGTV